MALFILNQSVLAVSLITQLAFCNVSKKESYYWAKKNVREDLILSELLSDYLSDVWDEIFCSENDDFVRVTKIVLWEK
jgi:hypothetical protein